MKTVSGEALQTFTKAIEHHKAGRLHKAETLYRRLLQTHPNHEDTLSNLGVLYLAQGKKRKALPFLRRVASVNPQNFTALYNLGSVLHEMGELEDAVQAYAAAHAIMPRDITACFNMANALRQLGRSEEAVAAYKTSIDIDPAYVGSYTNIGNTLADLGRLAEAVGYLQKALELQPDDPTLITNLGYAEQERGNLDDARRLYLRALECDPKFAFAHTHLGNVLQESGQLDEALKHYEQAAILQPENPGAIQNFRRALSRRIPRWHFTMLADQKRNSAYQRAIERAVDPSAHVLDIGTGSGLLALMAARAGAAAVTACEMSQPLAAAARQVIADNAMADRITVVDKRSTDLTIGDEIPQRADILVCEIFDAGLLGENALSTLRHALHNLITPDARIIPAAARIRGALMELPNRRAVHPVRSIAGFDLSAMDRFRVPHEYLPVDLLAEEHMALSEEISILDLDFRQLPPPRSAVEPLEITLEAHIIAGGQAHAMVFWFDLILDEETIVSTKPGGELRHWGQAAYFLETDKKVRAGETLRCKALFNDSALRFTL